MLKILIVDDEAIHREGIIQILHNKRPGYTVFEARNGQDALRIAETEQLDLIVTDVRMPRMDGLKFVEAIRNLNQKTRIVILSGYRNFDYAQKALQLGACEYLVKPIRENDFLSVLDKIEESIQSESQRDQDSTKVIRKLDDSLPVYFDKLMDLWIRGSASPDELQEISDLFSLHQEGVVLAVQFFNCADTPDNSYSIRGLVPQQQMKYRMKKILESLGSSVSFFSATNDLMMVTVLLSSCLQDPSYSNLSNQLRAFIECVWAESGLRVIIGIGSTCKDVLDDAATAFGQAQIALRAAYYDPEREVIAFDSIASLMGNGCPDLARFEDPLRTAIRQNDIEHLNIMVGQVFSFSVQAYLPPPELLIRNIIRLVLNTADVVSNFMEAQDYEELLIQVEYRLAACENLSLLKIEFKAILTELMDWLVNLKKNKHDIIMEMCIQYLEANLREDLTLKMVADHFYFSPSYFSALFKDYSGLTFNKYVSKLRLGKAAELLGKGYYRVYEVAQRVGINDEKYFYRVFKKEFGVTPDEYRRIQK